MSENYAGMFRSLARNIEAGNVSIEDFKVLEEGGRCYVSYTLVGEPKLMVEDLADRIEGGV